MATHYGGRVSPGAQNSRWWTEEDPADAVIAVARQVESDQGQREENDLVHARLYENQDLRNLYDTGLAIGLLSSLSDSLGHRVTFNVVQSCIDTAAAKIAKNKPRVMFLTEGGNWGQKRKAKLLTKFVDGLFDASKMYVHGQRSFVDSGVWGTGVVKIYAEGATIKAERVLPGEILVDDTESVYGEPRSLYQRKYVYRDVLAENFAKGDGDEARRRRAAIMAAPGGDPLRVDGRASDMVQVIEAWHLPSGKKAKDGRHVIAIEGCALVNEQWTKSYFPFVKFTWTERLVGYWGRGIAEQLHGIQLEINELLMRIQEAQRLCSVPRYLVEKNSELNFSHVTNEPGIKVEYTGQAPILWSQNAVPAELYQHLERLYQKAFEITGISMLSAASVKPAGLNSAVALREHHDIESERFVVLGQRYEQFYIDAAGIMIDLARELYTNSAKRIAAPGTKFLELISWSEVDLPEDSYIMRAFPTSILPTTPAGRLQKVQELYEAGFLPREQVMSLLDFPDLESVVSLQVAAYDDIQRIITNLVDKGRYETPEPAMNLQLAIQLTQSAYLKARNDGVPPKRLELLRRFMDDCQTLIAEATPPAPPPAPAAPPGAAPMPGAPPPIPDPGAMPMEAGTIAVPSELPAGPIG